MNEQDYEIWPELDGATDHSKRLFCDEMDCPCHEDKERVAELAQQVQEGLASVGDADRLYRGLTV